MYFQYIKCSITEHFSKLMLQSPQENDEKLADSKSKEGKVIETNFLYIQRNQGWEEFKIFFFI